MSKSIRRLLFVAAGLGTAAVALLGLACEGRPAGESFADREPEAVLEGQLLVVGGMIVTMDSDERVLEGSAVAIDDGRIVEIGPAAELLEKYPAAHRLDAEGRIVLPGLINTHTHAPMVLFRGLADDLELMDWLENVIFPAEAEHVDEEFVRWGTRLACLEMLTGGVTTFADMYYYEDVIAEEVERCGIRAVVGQTLVDFPAPDHRSWEEAVAYTRDFVSRWRGHPRVTPAVAPHSAYTVSRGHLEEAHRLAAELEVPLMIHLAEDRGEIERVRAATAQSSVEFLEGIGFLNPTLITAHVVWPSPEEIGMLARNGVGVAHCPQSNMKVAAGVAPVPAMLAAGVDVGLGTDGAASNNDLDLWEEMDTAAKLHKVEHLDPTLIDAREALRMATIGGARVLGLETEIGSIEVGKRADLIIVGVDGYHQTPHYEPYSLLVYSTKASDVQTVVVEGRVVVEGGRVTTIDVDEVRLQVATYRERLAGLASR